MVLVTKKIKKKKKKKFPYAHVYRTSKQKSKRHRYWCSEEPDVLDHLRRMRGIG